MTKTMMIDSNEIIRKEFTEAQNLLTTIISDEKLMFKIGEAAEIMSQAISRGNKIISCGNGGSMCDAMHFAEELSGKFREERPSLPAIAISDPAYLTCTSNDFGFESVFSRYIEGFGNNGDVLLAISTSGNSRNILNAVVTAKRKGITTISLTGNDGGSVGKTSDLEIRVPHHGYSDRIQEIHIKIIHVLIALIEKQLKYS